MTHNRGGGVAVVIDGVAMHGNKVNIYPVYDVDSFRLRDLRRALNMGFERMLTTVPVSPPMKQQQQQQQQHE